MDEKKQTTIKITIVSIIIVLLFALIFYLLVNHYLLNNDTTTTTTTTTTNSIVGTKLDEKTITNSDVAEIYNYVNNFTSLSSYTDTNYIASILDNYGMDNKITIDDDFVASLSDSDELIYNEYKNDDLEYYIPYLAVTEGLQTLLNKGIDLTMTSGDKVYTTCPMYIYLSSVDAFIVSNNCETESQISLVYDYTESESEIDVYKVSASVDNNNAVYTSNSILYSYKDGFYFTDSNIASFSRLEYIFKMNDNNEYYLSDIQTVE